MGEKMFHTISINRRELFPIVDIAIQSDYSEEIVAKLLLKLAMKFIDLAETFKGKLYEGKPAYEVTRVFGIRFGLIFPSKKARDDYTTDLVKILGK